MNWDWDKVSLNAKLTATILELFVFVLKYFACEFSQIQNDPRRIYYAYSRLHPRLFSTI